MTLTLPGHIGTYRSFWNEWLVSDGWRICRTANVFSSTQTPVAANISYIRLRGTEHNDGVFKLASVISWKESLSLPKIFAFPPPLWLWHVSIPKAYRYLAPISKPTTINRAGREVMEVIGSKIQRINNITPQKTTQIEFVRRLGYFALEWKIEKPANYGIYQQFLTDFDSFCRARQLFECKVARLLTWRANWYSTSVPRPLGEWTHLWTPTSRSDDSSPRPLTNSRGPPHSAPGPAVQQSLPSIGGPGEFKFDQVKRRVPAGTHHYDNISALQSTNGSVQKASRLALRVCKKRISRLKNSERKRVLSSTLGNAPPKKRPPPPPPPPPPSGQTDYKERGASAAGLC